MKTLQIAQMAANMVPADARTARGAGIGRLLMWLFYRVMNAVLAVWWTVYEVAQGRLLGVAAALY